MNHTFEKLCLLTKVSSLTKMEAAVCFIWYHQKIKKNDDIDIKTINQYFEKAHLATFPHSRLKENLTKSAKVTRGSETGKYKLKRGVIEDLDNKYLNHFEEKAISITERANLSETPFFNEQDINNAHQMAELYIIAHCFENSVRKFIDIVLIKELGTNWWDSVSSKDLREKYDSRKAKELRDKWVSSRNTGSPLYYLDWTDLVKIIRKEESRFKPFVNELKFVELRFEELERIRNVIAHNGVVAHNDDIDRIVLYFKDWCKQLSSE